MGIWDFVKRTKIYESIDPTSFSAPKSEAALVVKSWRALPKLTSQVLGTEGDRASAAADAAALLLAEMSPQQLPQLDEAIRSSFVLGYIGPELLERLPHHGDSQWAVLSLASCAPNGRTREAAIRELDAIESGFELPFLLLRANDWVIEVRRAARQAIGRRIRPDYCKHFVRALPMVVRLSGFRRVNHADLVAQIEKLLLDHAHDALINGMRSSDRWVRRGSIALLVRMNADGLAATVRTGIDDPDAGVALCAVRYSCNHASDAEMAELLERVELYHHPRVRLMLLETAAARQGLDTTYAFRAALFDCNRSIRELARYQLRDDAAVADGSVYAQALPIAKGAKLLGALAGLGDIARPEYACAVRPFLERTHPPRLRAEALTTYVRLTKHLEVILLEILADEKANLSKLALRLIVACRVTISESDVSPLLDSSLNHVRRNALVILLHQSKWKSLRWALRAFELPMLTEDDLSLAREHIENWEMRFNRSFVSPAPDVLREIATLLPRVAPRLNPRSVRFVKTVIEDGRL